MTLAPAALEPSRRARYSEGAGIYRIIPAAVARPTSLLELRIAVDAARDANWAVTPRGAGSAMDGSSVGEGLILDLTAFDAARCDISAVDRSARLSPAIALGALQRAAAHEGLRFPPDPSSAAWATMGGLVSTNASGARSVRFGSVRSWVTALTLETTDGPLSLARGLPPDLSHPAMVRWYTGVAPLIAQYADVIRGAYPAVRKNSAGYALDQMLQSGDILDIVIGSEGTLGVITDITVRLDPVPAHRASLRVALGTRQALVPAMEQLRQFGPSTLELLDASFLRLIEGSWSGHEALPKTAAGLLLADLESDDPDELRRRIEAAAAAVAPYAVDVQTARDPGAIEALWKVRHRASPILASLRDGRRSMQVIEDGCVPPERLGEYLDAIDEATARQGIDAVMFGHAGDGHLHVNLLPNVEQPGWLDAVRAIFHEVTATVIRLGGTTSGEHGAGRLRAGTLEGLYGPRVLEVFAAIKNAFDPEGRWNPGVITGQGGDPLARLKFGAAAVPLPAEIVERLRRIERDAAWAESRWD
ncbi:MAG: FAD-binding oxidoreductase [Gemmatimonadota bacterium]